MRGIREVLSSIDVNNLLKIFDIQIAICVFVLFLAFKNLFARIFIKI